MPEPSDELKAEIRGEKFHDAAINAFREMCVKSAEKIKFEDIEWTIVEAFIASMTRYIEACRSREERKGCSIMVLKDGPAIVNLISDDFDNSVLELEPVQLSAVLDDYFKYPEDSGDTLETMRKGLIAEIDHAYDRAVANQA